MLYGITIFLSAFLLFQVQPLIAKRILPWFGGSAAVWSTSLMFFQLALLGGYLYSFLLTRYLPARRQWMIHGLFLALSVVVLPIEPSLAWKPVDSSQPVGRILGLLTATVGLPYFLLSTTGPLVQAWYVRRNASSMPYRLYALSNAGSMLALLTFPIAVEPFLSVTGQSFAWSASYVVFALLCGFVAWRSRTESEAPVEASSTLDESEDELNAVGPALVVMWTLLSFCSSVLLVSVSNHMSQNVAPIPFLWILPLSLYLLSFILCFESKRAYWRVAYLLLLPATLAGLAFVIYYDQGNANIRYMIPGMAAGFFICCMVCHGELYRLKPHPRSLTLFYLMISVGGALGGVFVAMIAPVAFATNLELPIGIVLCGTLALTLIWNQIGRTRLIAALLVVAIAGYMAREEITNRGKYRLIARNFYGAMHVYDEDPTDDQHGKRLLQHGTITHGTQMLEPQYKHLVTSYYGRDSGMGRAMRVVQQNPARVGVIGLGAGVTAGFCRSIDHFQFYEINPLVLDIARNQFSFFNDCRAKKEVHLGDARLVLERQAPQQFDLLAVDAFSSDAIPVHLLTREAIELYFKHLKPRGILAVHISNKYLDLEPVLFRAAQVLDKRILTVDDEGEDAEYLYSTTWVLMTSDPLVLGEPTLASVESKPRLFKPIRIWTDDFSNLFEILK
jgi:hypothetical protein